MREHFLDLNQGRKSLTFLRVLSFFKPPHLLCLPKRCGVAMKHLSAGCDFFLQVGSAEKKGKRQKKKQRDYKKDKSGNSSDYILELTYKTLNESSISKKVPSGRTNADAVIADGGGDQQMKICSVHSHFLPKQTLLGKTTTQCLTSPL